MSKIKRTNFKESVEGIEVQRALRAMALDTTFNTMESYSANGILYPDHVISFVDKHMNYLNTHPNLDPNHYIANLRLMTRVR